MADKGKKTTRKKSASVKKPAKKPAGKKAPAKRAQATPLIQEAPPVDQSNAPVQTADSLPAPPAKKPKDLVQALTEYDEAADKKDDHEEVDPEALQRGDMPMTLVGHLDEFRGRFLKVLVTVVVLTIVGFFFSDYMLQMVNKPFVETGNKLNIFTLTGGFMLRLKASFGAGILIGMPVLVYQLWRFVAPAISREGRMLSRLTVFSAVALFYSGVAFVYFLLLPAAVKILLSFIGTDMNSMIGAEDYLGFIIFFSLAMGVLFEFPIVVLVLTKLGIITPQWLIRKRKIAIVAIFIIAGLITPTPDPINQIIVAIPLLIFYELSIIISRFVVVRKKKKELQEED